MKCVYIDIGIWGGGGDAIQGKIGKLFSAQDLPFQPCKPLLLPTSQQGENVLGKNLKSERSRPRADS